MSEGKGPTLEGFAAIYPVNVVCEAEHLPGGKAITYVRISQSIPGEENESEKHIPDSSPRFRTGLRGVRHAGRRIPGNFNSGAGR